jgi:hypothetical protein
MSEINRERYANCDDCKWGKTCGHLYYLKTLEDRGLQVFIRCPDFERKEEVNQNE